MQEEHHKKMKKQEMKVFTMYEGWDAEKEKPNRSTLVENPEKMLENIQIYAASVESPDEKDKSSQKALELYKYLDKHREGLLPYDKRGIETEAPPEGVIYKKMNVQESQNCTVITLRMTHRRMRWSVKRASNLVKVLYRKENRELIETIERYTHGIIFTMQMQESVETLSAEKAPKKREKGIHM